MLNEPEERTIYVVRQTQEDECTDYAFIAFTTYEEAEKCAKAHNEEYGNDYHSYEVDTIQLYTKFDGSV